MRSLSCKTTRRQPSRQFARTAWGPADPIARWGPVPRLVARLRLLLGLRLKTAAERSRGGAVAAMRLCSSSVGAVDSWDNAMNVRRICGAWFLTPSNLKWVDHCGCFGFLSWCALISPIFGEYTRNSKITPLF